MSKNWNDLSESEKQDFREKAADMSSKAEYLKSQLYSKAGLDENGNKKYGCEKNGDNECKSSLAKGVFSFLGGMAKSLEKMAKSLEKRMDEYSKKK